MSDTFKLSDIVSDKRKGCQQEPTAFFYALFVEVRQFPHGAVLAAPSISFPRRAWERDARRGEYGSVWELTNFDEQGIKKGCRLLLTAFSFITDDVGQLKGVRHLALDLSIHQRLL